uniref:Uncharacterized protein n=1 Tax=Utricularia reniformis TaxID=192314 RepID=A0A1Y0AYT6_9LAMI|nr:hypothetical protein AEK19_MT0737 [Utricularia reniformis]ART30307.1 hypothetical protein AEK19_MT0737 [Utricularia reniformis]
MDAIQIAWNDSETSNCNNLRVVTLDFSFPYGYLLTKISTRVDVIESSLGLRERKDRKRTMQNKSF